VVRKMNHKAVVRGRPKPGIQEGGKTGRIRSSVFQPTGGGRGGNLGLFKPPGERRGKVR